MKSNIELIKELYQNFANRDLDKIRQVFDPKIEWTQMKGFPNGGQYVGFDDIFENVFQGFSDDWTNWTANTEEFLEAGESVLAIGYYGGTYNKTGYTLKADFVHRYVLNNGKIVKFVQYTDTHLVAKAMGVSP